MSEGNRADDLGKVELGGSFEGINTSGLPASGPILDVRVETSAGEFKIVPIKPPLQNMEEWFDEKLGIQPKPNSGRKPLELKHSDTDLVMAQITEDPAMTMFTVPGVGQIQTSGSRLQRAITRNQNREELVWFGIDSSNLSAALGDRIIVRRDSLESEYVCKSCQGTGHTQEICKLCDGKQRRGEMECSACRVLGFQSDTHYPCGFRKCADCGGVGWKNGIVIPDVAQGKPVTGVVVSVGPQVATVKLGDRVLHSKFAGHTLEMKNETYTYMREQEVISLLRDL